MRLVTQNFTWLTCKDCKARIALYAGREYDTDTFVCDCEVTETKGDVINILKEYLSHPSVDGSQKKNDLRDELKSLLGIEVKEEAKRGRSRKVTETVQESV